jgi:hypothetical protein
MIEVRMNKIRIPRQRSSGSAEHGIRGIEADGEAKMWDEFGSTETATTS